jgi:hypothetical protein
MAVVTVFVDDAVCGRFPPVCAKTGQPSDGSLSLSHDVRGASSVSTAWLLLLLLLGPIGWLMLLVLGLANPRQTEWLTVQLPWSTEAMARLRAARAQRRNLWIGAAASLVGSAAALVAWTGAGTALDFPFQLAALALVGATVACVIGALVAEARVGRATVALELDASRRWVTLRGVAPEFARTVQARQSRSDQAYPSP